MTWVVQTHLPEHVVQPVCSTLRPVNSRLSHQAHGLYELRERLEEVGHREHRDYSLSMDIHELVVHQMSPI